MRRSSRSQENVARLNAYLKRRSEVFCALYSLAIYAFLIFEKLPAFPIYFFCDEAVAGVDAYSILTNGTDRFGTPYPIFFQGFGLYGQSLTVYLQVPFIKLFGLNEFAVRLTTACISLFGVAAVYVLIRLIFKMDSAWLTFAVFALSPVWFLHSRTGFEYIVAGSFFVAFGVFYILTFTRHWVFVIPAAVCGVATFYAHTTGRGWIAIACVLLFFLNLRAHLRYWKRLLLGLMVFTLLLGPYLYLQWYHPEITMKRLESLNFAEFKSKTLPQQIQHILHNYAIGLHPAFWYTWKGTQNSGPMERHIIPPLPLLLPWTFPFACVGVFMLFRHFRKLESRTLLALLFASPSSAALIEFNIHRGIAVGIFLLIFSLVGVGWVLYYLQSWPRVKLTLNVLLIVGLSSYAVWFRNHVYQVAPYAYKDYGLYGVQMGAPQIFQWIQKNYGRYQKIYVAYNLFNAGDIFIPFYLQGEAAQKTALFNIDQICRFNIDLPVATVYIVLSSFYPEIQSTGCPIKKELVATIPDVRGKPLFEIIRLRQEPTYGEWLQLNEKKRRILQKSYVYVKGRLVEVDHPKFDLGNPEALFDGNQQSLFRSANINPARILIHLPQPEHIKQILITISHTSEAEVAVKTYADVGQIDWGQKQYSRSGADLAVLTFEQPKVVSAAVTAIEITVRATDQDQYGFVHINEIEWK